MAFWTDSSIPEPLRQNRWYIAFSSNGLNNYRYALKECQKPSYEISVTEHKLLTQTFKYPGVLKWKPIEVKMVSTASGSNISGSAYDLFNTAYLSGYHDSSYGHQEINKLFSLENNGLEIIQINENGNRIEKWTLHNAFISNLNHGTLSYENDGFVDISFTIQYDWAELTT